MYPLGSIHGWMSGNGINRSRLNESMAQLCSVSPEQTATEKDGDRMKQRPIYVVQLISLLQLLNHIFLVWCF